MTNSLFIGLMSGTSMDGIDAALLDVSNHALLAGITKPYGDEARRALTCILNEPTTTPAAISQLHTLLGREFAEAVHVLLKQTSKASADIAAIGSHGQTICHDAQATIPYTLQLGCAHTIAELTGIPVVADFRTRDLVLGGQGAPFAPIYHQVLFAKEEKPLAVLNIGGIANLTCIADDGKVFGYDTGPGNCLLDAWIHHCLGLAYDADGAWAASGDVMEPRLLTCLADPYFQRSAPKSLGKEYFSLDWLSQCMQSNDAPNDVQATLLQLTVSTISDAVLKMQPLPKRLIVCGGGVHNKALVCALEQKLRDIPVIPSNALGIDPDYVEAMMFAWLASKTMHQIPIDVSNITGGKKATLLGAIYPVQR